jgi:hypothetical protein
MLRRHKIAAALGSAGAVGVWGACFGPIKFGPGKIPAHSRQSGNPVLGPRFRGDERIGPQACACSLAHRSARPVRLWPRRAARKTAWAGNADHAILDAGRQARSRLGGGHRGANRLRFPWQSGGDARPEKILHSRSDIAVARPGSSFGCGGAWFLQLNTSHASF